MNKAVTINLGGLFFYMDEDAYDKLKKYISSIKVYLSEDLESKEEIITDIEIRISEILSEKISNTKQVIDLKDIEDIVNIMGKPRDFISDDKTSDKDYYDDNEEKNKRIKKLYRDADNNILGGVASGLSYYFGIEKLWIRSLWVISLLFFGTGILIYLILWIVIPKVKSTHERLEMMGEPVNIDTIEKEIKDTFKNIKNSIDNQNIINRSVQFIKNVFTLAIDIIKRIGSFIGKILGFFTLISSVMIILTLIGSLFLNWNFTYYIEGIDIFHIEQFFFNSMFPIWILKTLIIVPIISFALMLFMIGLVLMSVNLRKIGVIVFLTLLGLFIISIIGISFMLFYD